MQRSLSFDAMPPLAVPLRFFLAAPAFATAAGLVLAWQGEAAFASRWSAGALAATHLLVLGCLAMTMCGALLQMLPVVGGVEVWRPRLTGALVFAALCGGTPALAAAFLGAGSWLFLLAGVLLGAAFALLLGACVRGLLHAAPLPALPTVAGMRLALAGLVITVTLGLLLASGLAQGLALPFMPLVRVHASWGLLGWIAMLVMGVAFQVIPMFQATPSYPAAYARWAPALLAASLLLATLALLSEAPSWFMLLPLALSLAAFALLTLRLLAQRRRAQGDPTTHNWRLAMLCLLACTLLGLLPVEGELRAFLLGVLFIAGVAMPVVHGMLFKILPFLLWYHLQDAAGIAYRPPSIRTLLGEPAAMRQLYLQMLALALLVAALFVPACARAAGIALAAASLGMLWNVVGAMAAFRRAQAQSLQP